MSLPFCYLCGKAFVPGDATNRDHVPPSAIFATVDRVQPLILRTHKTCNADQSLTDEMIGQLVSLLHRQSLTPKDIPKLNITFHAGQDSLEPPTSVLRDFPFRRIVFRWLRGFHAALYGEYLPPSVDGYVHAPMPEEEPQQHTFVPVYPVHYRYIETIKKNRVSKTTDRIVCRNGKVRYECVWAKTDRGERNLCIFALDVYGWQQLGDIHHAPARSCVGIYAPDTVPPNASYDTKLIFDFNNLHPLNAFSD